ncbi:hypothetical protein [Nocardioides antri]|uniref:Uncharacterized protein n=1 Tax=Nocardioides antri TaxID=2607659 RepID=A0A5B1M444_9ACTN|nr:hypothetical protein [Nocardioides antri]KAA1427416.1 hypothetical protein F0U47_08050 [Nocardioides antri]
MLHRRSTALVAVLLPLAAALTSCGFDYPTDRVNTIAAGVNNRDASVDVLGARVVAFAEGQGRLIGTLVYNENTAEEPAQLVKVEGEGVEVVVTNVEVAPNGRINLADDADAEPIQVTGDFTAGDVITLSYEFSTGEVVEADVPVVKHCGQYEHIADPGFDATDAAEDEHAEEEHAGDEHTEEADATFLCEHPTEAPEEEGGH